MQFKYTILYVKDVDASLDFMHKAFGLERKFYHESGYGELVTGETALAFASHELGRGNLPDGYVAADQGKTPLGMEVGLTTDNVKAAYDRAVAAGAQSIAPPKTKPWGQMVAYVRCPDGLLVEICSPM
ncbi:MAG: VOC family protein [Candidatus Symbiobacter sp.]|nr:VOC family protein [Candidatus Symbiobacter sp.]